MRWAQMRGTRALWTPKILFIDAGIAHLDPETEAKVFASLSARNITQVMLRTGPNR